MRLSLTLPELEAGKAVQTGASERILDICLAADRKDPFPIQPLKDHDHRVISVVKFTEDGVRNSNGRCTVCFKPVWNKTFTLYSARNRLLALIVELENGQYWVDETGYKNCKLTTGGQGADPQDVHNAQFTLGDLMTEPRRSYILLQAIELLKKVA